MITIYEFVYRNNLSACQACCYHWDPVMGGYGWVRASKRIWLGQGKITARKMVGRVRARVRK